MIWNIFPMNMSVSNGHIADAEELNLSVCYRHQAVIESAKVAAVIGMTGG
jgi:hypothetical protein